MKQETIKKRIFSARAARSLASAAGRGAAVLVAAVTMLTMTAQPTRAENVNLSTVTENKTLQNGDVATGTLDAKVKISIAEGATVTLSGVTINGDKNNNYTWAGLNCEGDATIILADGSENTVKAFDFKYPGIHVPQNKTLTIRGGTAGTGKLNASAHKRGAGIGGGYNIHCGNIVIEGGEITATSGEASGIGCGSYGSNCGNITISGGTVTASGGNGFPGIGSGNSGTCGDITISGTASVAATTVGNAAGIGSGDWDSHCGNITISTTGVVTATGGSQSAGIGSGKGGYSSGESKYYPSTCGNILITAGTVTASGGTNGAGIGSSSMGSCGTIEIQGGTVTATGGQNAAGIGSGYDAGGKDRRCGTITISGGTVTATGGDNAAGIGTGYCNACGSITITEGVASVTATKGTGAQNHIGLGADLGDAHSAILDKDGNGDDVAGTISIAASLCDSGEDGDSRTVYLYVLSEATGIDATIATAIAGKAAQFQRTGITADAYSTVCLPFDFTAPSGCTFYGFQGIHYDENGLGAGQGVWVADIAEATTLKAHTPYIFKSTGTEVNFSGTASNAADYGSALTSNAVSASLGDDKAWTFKGTYEPISWADADPAEPTYGFASYVPAATIAAGTFVRFVQGASLAPFRARLIYSGNDTHLKARKRGAAEGELSQYIIVRIVGGDGSTTAIGTLDTRTGEISTGDWFDLNGRRLSGKPSQRGIYINNGKKVVVK